MTRSLLAKFLSVLGFIACLTLRAQAETKRLVVVKVDGLSADLLEQNIDQLPWMRHVFVERGAWVRNFYVRGISLSAPSWSMLDTGQQMLIRGNAEFDRLIPRVYDYLNFFPFYVGYARSRRVDMPGVEVLDQEGVMLLMDAFEKDQRYQSMQLYQRGVRWETLAGSLRRKVARPVKDLIDASQTGFDMGEGIEWQQERELIAALRDPRIIYLDYFTGDLDHTSHLTSDVASQLSVLKRLDAKVGRIWTAIQGTPLASETTMVLVSDHGINSTPGIYSQGYNLVRFFNSADGGGHHVTSTRHPMSEYKLRGLDPFVSEVITPSEHSFYLRDEKDWPTAMLDLDGNERASVQLRNSDLNEIQILSQQLRRSDLKTTQRRPIRDGILCIIDRNRTKWSETVTELSEELSALRRAIERQRTRVAGAGEEARRQAVTLETWQKDERGYAEYVRGMQRLLDLRATDLETVAVLPKGVLGEPNSISQLKNYTVGLSRDGLAFSEDGSLDLDRTFTRLNYFEKLAEARVRNVVQQHLGAKPVDFIAVRAREGVYLYADAQHGALIQSRVQNGELRLRYMPVSALHFTPAEWAEGFPLHLFEDPELGVPGDRKAWLNEWHSEREWLEATHRTRYSNGVIGLHEYFAPWEPASVPPIFRIAEERDWPVLRRFAVRRRQVVEPDLLILASDHWNFNVRGFNPGGNHGSFFRISTHSVLLAAGGGVPAGARIDRPYDSLSFVPTLLELMGRSQDGGLPGPVIGELLVKH